MILAIFMGLIFLSNSTCSYIKTDAVFESKELEGGSGIGRGSGNGKNMKSKAWEGKEKQNRVEESGREMGK